MDFPFSFYTKAGRRGNQKRKVRCGGFDVLVIPVDSVSKNRKSQGISYFWMTGTGGSFISEAVRSVTTDEKCSLINQTTVNLAARFVRVLCRKGVSYNVAGLSVTTPTKGI